MAAIAAWVALVPKGTMQMWARVNRSPYSALQVSHVMLVDSLGRGLYFEAPVKFDMGNIEVEDQAQGACREVLEGWYAAKMHEQLAAPAASPAAPV